MSGVTLSDLSKYHQGAMKWFKDGLVSEHNKLYATTEDAGAVSFWPLGGTPLEGKVKFSFKETPPASGEKGPENPSTISGVSSIKVCHRGKNLLSLPYRTESGVKQDVTCTVRDDYSVLLNGTASERFAFNLDNTILFHSGVNYVSSGYPESYTKGYLGVSGGRYQSGGNALNITVPSTINLGCWIEVKVGSSYSNMIVYPQVELGTVKTDYEAPIARKDYTIPLNSTYYGGEIDLATGVMTVTHYGIVLTGMVAADAYNGSGLLFLRSWPNGYDTDHISEHGILRPKKSSGIFCDRFPTSGSSDRFVIGNYNSANQTEYLALYLNPETVGITESSLTGSEVRSKVNAYLANHPITIVYELYTPYTVQLTPLQLTALAQKDKYTPRINTVYTDADSVQITYRKSLIHDEDEKVQAIVALGGNV